MRQMRAHLETHGLIDKDQHGFMPGRSTETQLLHMVNEWTAIINRGHTVHCVYFDFSKAFDKCCHSLLLAKLTSLGFSRDAVSWVASYLRDRRFVTRVGSADSDVSACPSGVPQGSSLGPLAYLCSRPLPRSFARSPS